MPRLLSEVAALNRDARVSPADLILSAGIIPAAFRHSDARHDADVFEVIMYYFASEEQ